MAPHSSTLAWKIPWMEEPCRLQSMGLHRVGHDWATSLSLFTFMHWRRKWQPTPVFLPGESQGRGSLVGCHLWGRIESDTTEATQQQQQGWKTKKFWVWWSGDPIHTVTLSLISYMTYVVFFNSKMGLVYNLPWRVPVWDQWDTYKMLRCGQKVWQLLSKFTKRLLL